MIAAIIHPSCGRQWSSAIRFARRNADGRRGSDEVPPCRACVCARVRACLRAHVRACVRGRGAAVPCEGVRVRARARSCARVRMCVRR